MNEQELSTQQLMELLHTFICEMESTLNDENKKNRKYAPQVFWKNKYTLELLEKRLGKLAAQECVIKTLQDVIEFSTKVPEIKPTEEGGFEVLSSIGMRITRDIENRKRELLRAWVLETCFPKELKAIQIIKEKRIDVWCFRKCLEEHGGLPFNTMGDDEKALKVYNETCINKQEELAQEEFDLLKEVLL